MKSSLYIDKQIFFYHESHCNIMSFVTNEKSKVLTEISENLCVLKKLVYCLNHEREEKELRTSFNEFNLNHRRVKMINLLQ